MRFSVRSNCVAHGKTKHNKLVVPVVLDITRGDDDLQVHLYIQDDEKDENGEMMVIRRPETEHALHIPTQTRSRNAKVILFKSMH